MQVQIYCIMNIFKPYKGAALLLGGLLMLASCSKTEDTLGDDAACELYLSGLSYDCTGEVCVYTARLENNEGGGEFDLEITKATYDHYKEIAEQKEANICWEGEVE